MKSKFTRNLNPLVDELSNILASGAKNSHYENEDIAYRAIQAGVDNLSFEAMFKLNGYLSADRMLDKLHCLSEERVRELLWNVNKELQLPDEVTVAIDFTDKEYYGDKNHPQIMGAKGGKYVNRTIEMSTVDPALFIDCLPVNQFTNNKEKLLIELISSFNTNFKDTEIRQLLIDRGFFTKKVVSLLIYRDIDFLMPAVKNRAIKKLVEKFKRGEIESRIEYEFGKATIELLFIEVDSDIYVYATNMDLKPIEAFDLYRNRWQIETNFREQNKFKFRTKTKDFSIRYLSFVLAGLLFNCWQLTREEVEYTLESYIYKKIIIDELLKMWREVVGREVVKSIVYLTDT